MPILDAGMGDLCWADEGVNGASLGQAMRTSLVLVVLELQTIKAADVPVGLLIQKVTSAALAAP